MTEDEASEAGHETDEFEEERAVTREEAAALLHDLADGVASGSVAFDDGEVAVEVPATLELELEYEREGDEREIEVELEWGEESDAGDTDDSAMGDADTADEAGSESGTAEDDGSAGDSNGDGGADEPGTSTDEPTVVGIDGADVEGLVGPGQEPRSRARFELYRDRADEWRWRLVHHNGNIVADGGEGYSRKRSARNGLESVRRNAPGAAVVEQD